MCFFPCDDFLFDGDLDLFDEDISWDVSNN